MDDVRPDPQLAELTAEMAWLRRLARSLLRTEDAHDLAQEAWIVAAEKRPADDRPLRPWLSRVTRNLVRMQARGRTRREARESSVAEAAAPAATPAELVQRVELQQLVASEVLRLGEPYRSTVLLHFFEELTCAEIARRLDLPEGTVRRRLKVALDELRARIAAREQRNGGLVVLVPLAGAGLPAQPAMSLALGAMIMKKIGVVVLVLLLVVAALLWRSHRTDSTTAHEEGRGSGGAHAAVAAGGSARAGSDESNPDVMRWLIQADVPPKRIAGRVTFRGAPVVNATVELASLASESGLGPAPLRTTNAAGEFDFGEQSAMPWSVRATAPGKAGARIDVDLREPRGAPDRLELQLGACTAAMFGLVRDASGGPIAKARIARIPDRLSPVPGGVVATTDDKGNYELCVETRWPGVVGVEVSADGYAAITSTMIVPGRLHVDFALVPEATIVGRVIRDDTSAPIPHAYVFVPYGPRGSESTPLRGTFTDASGSFRLDRMTAGRHLVFARADGMSESIQGTPAVVGVGQTSAEIEIRLEAGSTVRGTVVDHERRPIGGAHVAAIDPARGTATATALSQEDGSFVLTGVPRAEIQFTAQPYDVVTPTTFRVSQPTHDGVTLEIEPLGTIIGRAVRKDKPVAGANIDIQGPNANELQPILTDAQGRFEARGLRPGPWTLFAEDTRIGAFGRAPETVQLGRGETKEITIDIAYAASISGRVIDQDGKPVPGVTTFFRHTQSDDAGQATTDIDGNFRAATMTGGGDYRPSVMRNLLASSELRPVNGTPFPSIKLADGNAAATGIVLAVQLDRLALAGMVVDADGIPVPDARVAAKLIDGTANPRFVRTTQDPADTTNVDGRFAIEDLAAGTYALQARSATGIDVIQPGIRAGRTDVTLVLPSPGAIDVSTVGFTNGVQVSALRSDGGPAAPTVATLQGAVYALRNLSPGSYVVTARTASEAASAVVEVVAGRTTRTTLTSKGSGIVVGRVRDFRTGKPVEGMTCRALPRLAVSSGAQQGTGVRTDPPGAFQITAAPAGQIAIACDGLWRNYSDGLRLTTLEPQQRVDLEVPVVAWSEEPGRPLASIGAELEADTLAPRLTRVQPNGPAATAGFIEGDVIVTVDSAPVAELSPYGISVLIQNRAPGTKVKLGVTRAGKTINGEVTLGDAPF